VSAILRPCAEAMPEHAKLLTVERPVPGGRFAIVAGVREHSHDVQRRGT
jgi:hypothetical protein